ncbi:MAG: ShlB/FhaC/HecB family hemolysin secretion/activation protein, partial [Gammaproteobacteria bacterium]|nr:ShlB/FhaC/HecB family hemolysin secretion/activation protein [Gammaproteobacteria bacterium]
MHLGKPIDAELAQAIASAIAAKYAADGYSRPNVRIDDRMIGAGVLALDVVETRISSMQIVGDPGPYEDRLHALGRGLYADSLLRTSDLQSTVRRMRALPGLTLSAATSRDAELPGAYTLNLDTEFRPVTGMARMSNRGTDEIGTDFVLGQVTANGLFAGRANVGLLFGAATDYDEYHGAGLNGSVAVGSGETRVIASGFRSRSDPNEAPADRDDRYVRDRGSVMVAKPLRDSAERQLMLTAGLRSEDLAIDRAGLRLRDERLRLVEFGLRWTKRPRPASQYAVGFELIRGIDGIGAGLRADDLSNDPRRVDLSMLVVDYVRVAQLNSVWSWRLNALAQHSNDVLPYLERFKIGGDRLGRGFEVAEISGDRGLGARVETLRRVDALQSAVGAVSFYLTYDLAAAWKNDLPGRESAATAGAGLVLNGEAMSGRIEIAKPL